MIFASFTKHYKIRTDRDPTNSALAVTYLIIFLIIYLEAQILTHLFLLF